MTKIPESLIESVPNWSFETLYENFDLLEPTESIRKKVEEGIDLHFPIEWYIEGDYEEFPNTNSVRVKGYGINSLLRFRKEIKERKKLMLKFIYEHFDNDVTQGRINDY